MKKTLFILTPLLLLSLACSLFEGVEEQITQNLPSPTSTEVVSSNPQSATQEEDTFYLFSPNGSTTTYLMNTDGVAYYAWESKYTPGNSVYLLENGNLLRAGRIESGLDVGGAGGIIEEIAPDNTVVWSYQYINENGQLHHDIALLPNGNILTLAWERKTEAESLAVGRDPNLISKGEVWSDSVLEINPKTNEIVWEWHVWDHLVQDFDNTKENYGDVAEHPNLINLNYPHRRAKGDWIHLNAIDYNAELDQILLSSRIFSEIWIIDHGTTTAEAAGEKGDLLYRWGNPQAYDSGRNDSQQLFGQHDAQWIGAGLPGEGHILIFNNGDEKKRPYSTVDEIIPPLNADGRYTLSAPDAPIWRYTADTPKDFYADHISGAERLANGNTLISNGIEGIFFEVTPEGKEVWRYEYGGQTFRVTAISSNTPGLQTLNLQPGEVLKAKPREPKEGAPNNNLVRQKAIEACSGLPEGAVCTMNPPNGEVVNGVCQQEKSQLVCTPDK